MNYKNNGYNRLLVGNLYNWRLDRFESLITEENAYSQNKMKT